MNLSFKSIPIAFSKKCYSHIAFVINRLGPGLIERLVESQKRTDPSLSRLEEVEAYAKKAKEAISSLWELFGYIEYDDKKIRHQLDSAIGLAEITKRLL